MSVKYKFGMVECRTSCPRCANPMLINGPVKKILCRYCQSEIILPEGLIYNLVESFFERKDKKGWRNFSLMTKGYALTISINNEYPVCGRCRQQFPVLEMDPDNIPSEITCAGCNEATPVHRAPESIRHVLKHNVDIIIGGQFDEPDGLPEKPAIEGVVLNCPMCGSGMKIDGIERIVPCKFCDSKVYLPDDLWLRLHPVKKVMPWYLGYYKNQPGKPV